MGVTVLAVIGGIGLLFALVGGLTSGVAGFMVFMGLTALLLGGGAVIIGRPGWALIGTRKLGAGILAAGLVLVIGGAALAPAAAGAADPQTRATLSTAQPSSSELERQTFAAEVTGTTGAATSSAPSQTSATAQPAPDSSASLLAAADADRAAAAARASAEQQAAQASAAAQAQAEQEQQASLASAGAQADAERQAAAAQAQAAAQASAAAQADAERQAAAAQAQAVPQAVEQSAPAVPSTPGPTALCVDGTLSYAAHHQGACSHHGGVATFYK